MEEAIIAYSRLLIALMGFFVPMILFLFGNYKQGKSLLIEKKELLNRDFNKIRKDSDASTAKNMREISTSFDKRIDKVDKSILRIEPMRQFKWLFFPLLIAFVLIEVFFLVECECEGITGYKLFMWITIFMSIGFFSLFLVKASQLVKLINTIQEARTDNEPDRTISITI